MTRDPQGKPFFDATADRSIRLWELATGREVRRFGGERRDPPRTDVQPRRHHAGTREKRPSTSRRWSTTSPGSTRLHLWDVATGREIRRWEVRAAEYGVPGLRARRERTWPGSAATRTSSGSGTRPPAARSGRSPATAPRSGTPSSRPTASALVTVSEDRTLRFWDTATGAETRQIEASDERIWFAALSADGQILATGGGLRPARLWDAASRPDAPRVLRPRRAFRLVRRPLGRRQDPGDSESNGVILWDTATGQRRVAKGQPTSRYEDNHMIKSLRFAPDGKSVATLGGDWVRFWDVDKAEEIRRFALPNKGRLDGIHAGRRPARIRARRSNAGSDERARRPHLPARRRPRAASGTRIDGPQNRFKALAFSPDGKILATGIDTGQRVGQRELAIRLWDVAGRQGTGHASLRTGRTSGPWPSPADGRRLVSASEDGTALVWDVARIIGRRTAAESGRDPRLK